MKTFFRSDARGDFGVALQALKRALAPEFVAAGAIRSAVQKLVRPGKRAGGDLRVARTNRRQQTNECEKAECAELLPHRPDCHFTR